MLATLRNRDFCLLWFAGLISIMGDWVLYAALPLYAYQQTGSALASGAVFAAMTLPGILIGSVAGVFVDRWDRRRTMIYANLLQALALLPLFAVGVSGYLWPAYVVVFLISTASKFFSPAENALLPRLVGEEKLVSANSLNALNDNLARIAGPALGGMLVAYSGLVGIVIVDGLTFLLSAALIMLIRSREAGSRSASTRTTIAEVEISGTQSLEIVRSLWREWTEGLRAIWVHRMLKSLFAVIGIALLADSILGALLAPFVEDVLGGGASAFGFLLTARGVGGLIGGTLVGYFSARVSTQRLLTISLFAFGIGVAVLANVQGVPAALGVWLLAGIPAVGWWASQQTLLQLSASDSNRGRIFGAYESSSALMLLAGSLAGGALADYLGIVRLLESAAVLYIVAGIVAVSLLWSSGKQPPSRSRKA